MLGKWGGRMALGLVQIVFAMIAGMLLFRIDWGGSLPMVLHPNPRETLVVAFGGGITLAAVERLRPQRIEVVEIVPGVVGAAPLFSEHNNSVFERLESHLRIKAGGTGLGLYLTKKIATEILGGEIKVASEAGQGSTFTLNIPHDYETAQSELRL